MIDKLDAFLCYYSFLLLSLSHRVLSSYPNFSVIFTPGELIRVWCQGLRSLCGVHRSPDWLNSRPLRWLSCHRRLHHFSRSLHFSEGLDVADLSQDGKFASVFPTGNAPHRRSIGCPVATRRSSNWAMVSAVSAQLLYFAHFNYTNPCHKIYRFRQGYKASGRSNWPSGFEDIPRHERL